MQVEQSLERSTPEKTDHPYADPKGWCGERADPFLNRIGPPVRVQLPYGEEGWMVTRFADVRFIFSDRRFGHSLQTGRDIPRVVVVPSSRLTLIARSDPPEHNRLRRLFNDSFTTARSQRRRPLVEQLALAGIDRLIANGPPGDLVRDLFDPVALAVVGDVMGVPEQDRQLIRTWTRVHQGTAVTPAEFEQNVANACAYFEDLVRLRLEHSGDDAISDALRIRAKCGDSRSDADVASLAAALFTTGVESISGQLQTSTHSLLTHPIEFTRLRDHRELLPRAVEELCRYAPLVVGGARARRVIEDVEVGGVLLRAGDSVVPHAGAAGFDPEAFPDPYRLDISRPPGPTLIFGFGAHYCQAAQFSRMVLAAVLPLLTERLPDLRMAVPNEHLRWQKSRVRGFEALPVSWGPSRP